MKFTAWQDLDGNEIANAAYPSGIVLVKSQTIGTAVSSVTVNDAFSSEFDNYRIIISGGGGSTDTLLRLQLGNTTSGYYTAKLGAYASGASAYNASTNYWAHLGSASGGSLNADATVMQPYLTERTFMHGFFSFAGTTGSEFGISGAYLDNATSYTDFTVFTQNGTITGGTIRVYGYRN